MQWSLYWPIPAASDNRTPDCGHRQCTGWSKAWYLSQWNLGRKVQEDLAPSVWYKKHGREKKRAHEQRVREVEHSSFTPLVLTATGGLRTEATSFYKCLASMLSMKWDSPYSITSCWLRWCLTFSLLHSSIQAIRGARSSLGHAIKSPSTMDLVTTEARISRDMIHS